MHTQTLPESSQRQDPSSVLARTDLSYLSSVPESRPSSAGSLCLQVTQEARASASTQGRLGQGLCPRPFTWYWQDSCPNGGLRTFLSAWTLCRFFGLGSLRAAHTMWSCFSKARDQRQTHRRTETQRQRQRMNTGEREPGEVADFPPAVWK